MKNQLANYAQYQIKKSFIHIQWLTSIANFLFHYFLLKNDTSIKKNLPPYTPTYFNYVTLNKSSRIPRKLR